MSRRNRRIMAVLFCLIFSFGMVRAQSDPVMLRLPFRFAAGSAAPDTLTVNDLRLTVNGKSTAPGSLLTHLRSLSESRGRNRIILSFTSGSPGDRLGPFLDLFYRSILTRGDQLVVCSPLSSFGVPAPAQENTPFPGDALTRLSEDLETFNGMLAGLEKQLDELAGGFPKKPGSAQWKKQFSRYEREVSRMRQHLLAAVLTRLSEGFALLSEGDAPPWLILLDGNRPLIDRISWPFKDQESGSVSPEAATLQANLVSTLNPEHEPGLNDLTDKLMLDRIGLIALSMTDSREAASGSTYLDFIRRRCGIEPFVFSDAAEAVSRISSTIDRLYELIYPFDGTVGDKQLRLNCTMGQTLAYPPVLKAELFGPPAGQGEGPLSLDRLEVIEGEIHIGIGGIRLENKSGSTGGKVRVRVIVRDENNRICFDQEKELPARQPEMNIRLPFPSDLRGYYSLSVEVLEADGGRSTRKTVYGKVTCDL